MSAALETAVDCGLALADIPVGEGRAGVVGEEQVAVFRTRSGDVRAVAARCPHRGGPLADGLVDDDVVVCPLHNRTYDLVTGAEADGHEPVRAWVAEVDPDGRIRCRPA